MALFNYATKEITLKIVYYGPGLSGKTTNLQYLHSILNPETKGRLLSLSTEADRTLFFDFLPVELGKIRDFSIRFQLYTVPGQVRYNATRKVVLKGADAVVFVADSQRDMREQNIESFENMRENLLANNINPDGVPVVLQYNKRDLGSVLSVADLNRDLNRSQYHVVEASAISGTGVEDSFRLITRLLLKHIAKKHQIEIQPPQKEKEMPGPRLAESEKEDIAAPIPPEPFAPPAVPAFGVERAQGLWPEEKPIEEKEPAISGPLITGKDETAIKRGTASSSNTSTSSATPQTHGAEKAQGLLPKEEESAEEGVMEERTPSVEEVAPTTGEQTPPSAVPGGPEEVVGPEIKALPSIPPEKVEGVMEEISTIARLLADFRNSIHDLSDDVKDLKVAKKRREDQLVTELPNVIGLLTDLKNSVYVLSKELKDTRKGQEETNRILREISALFERLRTRKSWFRF